MTQSLQIYTYIVLVEHSVSLKKKNINKKYMYIYVFRDHAQMLLKNYYYNIVFLQPISYSFTPLCWVQFILETFD